MAQQRSRIPKFGNWEGESVPYTARFENARQEKAFVMINPNDPQENPDAFNLEAAAPPKKNRFHKRNTSDQLKSGTHRSTPSTSSSDKTASHDSSVNSIRKRHHQRRRSDRACYGDDYSCRSVTVPKFGEWDENNPTSAEGFTVIFDRVKEEKQIAAAKFPTVPVIVHQDVNKFHQKEDTRGKKCCGLF